MFVEVLGRMECGVTLYWVRVSASQCEIVLEMDGEWMPSNVSVLTSTEIRLRIVKVSYDTCHSSQLK